MTKTRNLGSIFIFSIKKIVHETRVSGLFLIKFGPKSCILALFYCLKSYVSAFFIEIVIRSTISGFYIKTRAGSGPGQVFIFLSPGRAGPAFIFILLNPGRAGFKNVG